MYCNVRHNPNNLYCLFDVSYFERKQLARHTAYIQGIFPADAESIHGKAAGDDMTGFDSLTGILTASGWAAVNRWLPLIRDNKPSILMELQCERRQKVLAMLEEKHFRPVRGKRLERSCYRDGWHTGHGHIRANNLQAFLRRHGAAGAD
uniref:Uncharacterized protein n=1 Tax=Candidatus Nitrotoga fabula TaxID=2182327 RepID=A0A2X0QWB7_9PROT|nr:protein of unknown function [Candidatus Nitrotoga fabula]